MPSFGFHVVLTLRVETDNDKNDHPKVGLNNFISSLVCFKWKKKALHSR